MNDRQRLARDAGLVAVVFVGTVILLAGLALGLAVRSPTGSPGPVSGAASPTVPDTPRPSAAASASASAAADADPVLVGAGDIADCGLSGDEETAKLLDGIDGTVFTAGDNAYPDGTAGQYAQCYGPTWGRFEARTRPAVGNHDYETKGAAGYLGYFGAAAASAEGKTWYSYDLGTWHVVVLDSNCKPAGGCDPASEQGTWLAADLAAMTTTCTLAIWHHPRFSSGEHGNDLEVAPFWQALYDSGADLVVNGHDHDYERFAPQSPDGQEDRARGIRQFVAGTGGAALRDFATIAANSELRVSASHGVLKLTLRRTSYEWSWIPTSGTVTDSGSGPCH